MFTLYSKRTRELHWLQIATTWFALYTNDEAYSTAAPQWSKRSDHTMLRVTLSLQLHSMH